MKDIGTAFGEERLKGRKILVGGWVHLGFLDGTFGFLVARQSAAMVHLQHAALWAAEQGTLTPARDTSGQRACAPFYNPDLP